MKSSNGSKVDNGSVFEAGTDDEAGRRNANCMTRIVGTIEARMGSSRLPGKTMAELHEGRSLLECVVRRFRACKRVDEVVVATTVEAGDDRIADWCTQNGVALFRGSEDDVLERVAAAAIHYRADAIVQMGADSAYLDFELIDQLVEIYVHEDADYVCNDLTLTCPLGIYGHVVRVESLLGTRARPDLTANDRSDVVRYIFEHPGTYRIHAIEAPPELACPELRLTIDYPEDMEQARTVYRRLGGLFRTPQILALYRAEPALFAKTRNLVQHSAPFLSKK
jgi:spore coat polysaccharide biosynthesis protein SpsF